MSRFDKQNIEDWPFSIYACGVGLLKESDWHSFLEKFNLVLESPFETLPYCTRTSMVQKKGKLGAINTVIGMVADMSTKHTTDGRKFLSQIRLDLFFAPFPELLADSSTAFFLGLASRFNVCSERIETSPWDDPSSILLRCNVW